jgi:hypothetical protein
MILVVLWRSLGGLFKLANFAPRKPKIGFFSKIRNCLGIMAAEKNETLLIGISKGKLR